MELEILLEKEKAQRAQEAEKHANILRIAYRKRRKERRRRKHSVQEMKVSRTRVCWRSKRKNVDYRSRIRGVAGHMTELRIGDSPKIRGAGIECIVTGHYCVCHGRGCLARHLMIYNN